MNRAELRNAYKHFFESEAGNHLVEALQKMWNSNVTEAMNTNSLDSLSRAKGNKEVIDHIQSVMQITKKGSLPKE